LKQGEDMAKENPDPQFELKQLRPAEHGSRKALFDLESEIMEVVWNHNARRVLVRDVHAILERRRAIAYTTVMTTMDRLWKKGVLERESQGKAYAYWARLSREAFHRQVAAQVIDSLLPEVTEPLLASFVDHTAQSDPAHLDRLEELIRSKREQLERDRRQGK
jgi:predicted transcriptional regulator